jgi:hypothetical protein
VSLRLALPHLLEQLRVHLPAIALVHAGAISRRRRRAPAAPTGPGVYWGPRGWGGVAFTSVPFQ